MYGCFSCRRIHQTSAQLKKPGLILKNGRTVMLPVLTLLKMPSTLSFSFLLLNGYILSGFPRFFYPLRGFGRGSNESYFFTADDTGIHRLRTFGSTLMLFLLICAIIFIRVICGFIRFNHSFPGKNRS
jgi:hypothetical protein